MFRTLSLVAALALAPAAASAQDRDAPTAAEVCSAEVSDVSITDDMDDAPETPSVQRLEEAARAFGEKMEAFGTRAGAVCKDASLDDEQKEQQIAALWREYEPDLKAFTAFAAGIGPQIAAEVLAEIDIAAVVEDAMIEVNQSGVVQGAVGMAQNTALNYSDPEHLATLGLVAEYAAGEAIDAMEEAKTEKAAPAPHADH